MISHKMGTNEVLLTGGALSTGSGAQSAVGVGQGGEPHASAEGLMDRKGEEGSMRSLPG